MEANTQGSSSPKTSIMWPKMLCLWPRRLNLIEVSAFKDERVFDIIRHHYGYTHECANTGVLINICTGLDPD
jgi:hypothetical protein